MPAGYTPSWANSSYNPAANISRTSIPISNVAQFSGVYPGMQWGNAIPNSIGSALPYLPGVMDIYGGNTEAGIGSLAGTAIGSAASGTAIGTALGNLIPIPGIGALLGGMAGRFIGSQFANEDPDQYLWGDAVKRITGNDPDGWGSGGDWSSFFQGKGIDLGTADHYGALIRQKQMNPDAAMQAMGLAGGGGGSGGGGYEGGGGESAMSTSSFEDMLPEFNRSEQFSDVQKQLGKIGKDFLKWEPSESLAAIGESGGAEFQKMLASVTANTMRAVGENQAGRGVRGGLGGVQTAQAVGDVGAQLGYQDYARAMQGRQALGGMEQAYAGMGANVTEGVRGAEAQMNLAENTYGLNRGIAVGNYSQNQERLAQAQQQINQQYELGMISAEQAQQRIDIAQTQFQDQMDWNEEQANDSFWGDLIGSGISLYGQYKGYQQQDQFMDLLSNKWDIPRSQEYGSSSSKGFFDFLG